MMDYYDYGSMGIFGGIFMIIWWLLIVVAIIAIVRWIIQSTKGKYATDNGAYELLRTRYAKGEIDKKEFEEKRKELAEKD